MAELNKDHDPNDPNSCELKWIHPERMFSCDETDVSLNQAKMKSKKDREVVGIEEVSPQTIHVKSSRKISFCFGRTGDNQSMTPFFVFGGAQNVNQFWTSDEIRGEVKDENGNLIPTQYAANDKGSVNEEMFHEIYVKQIIIPAARARGVRKEDGHRGIFLFDGVQTHLSEASMKLLDENGIRVILRPPNTSSLLQGEDTVVFRFVLFFFEIASNTNPPLSFSFVVCSKQSFANK